MYQGGDTMIIWLNGAFGSGKTRTAYELHRRIPQSYIFDPENIGFCIREFGVK
jgi:adenylylsulfate kinase-like enzyme